MNDVSPIRLRNERYISKFIRGAPGAMYDIGVGPKTEWRTLKELYPDMMLFGCEPDPRQFPELEAKFPGKLKQVAIAEHAGYATLYGRSDSPMHSSLLKIDKTNRANTVSLWTLDGFDAWAGRQSRILLWMDIEGGELAALKGAHKLLSSRRVRWINLEERAEGHQPEGDWAKPEELRELLKEYGYRRAVIYNKHPTHHDVIYVHRLEKLP